MIPAATEIPGAFVLDVERIEDERGFFARTWCAREAAALGMNPRLVQCSLSFNVNAHTLRGLHLQASPHAEAKLVRCSRGAVHDVILDLRPESPAFLRSVAVELTSENRRMLYVPEGVAHGFLTLQPNTEVFYQMSEFYTADTALGYRWNDPAFAIEWPARPAVLSRRDREFPDFQR